MKKAHKAIGAGTLFIIINLFAAALAVSAAGAMSSSCEHQGSVHWDKNSHRVEIPMEFSRSGRVSGTIAHSDGHEMRLEWVYPNDPQDGETVAIRVAGQYVKSLGDLPDDVKFTGNVSTTINRRVEAGSRKVTLVGGGDSQTVSWCLNAVLDPIPVATTTTTAAPAPVVEESTPSSTRVPVQTSSTSTSNDPVVVQVGPELALTGPAETAAGMALAALILLGGGTAALRRSRRI